MSFRRFIFFLTCYIGLIFATMVLVLAIPSTISLSHKLPNATLIWINNMSLVSSVSFSLIVGALCERINNRVLLSSILAISLVSLIVYAYTDNGILIVFSRLFQSIIFGIYPILYKNIYSFFNQQEKKQRRKSIIFSNLTSNISSPIALYGFFVIGYLEKDKLYNFHSLYNILILGNILLLLLAFLSQTPANIVSKVKGSYYSALIYGTSLIAIAYGINTINLGSSIYKYTILYIILGIAAFSLTFLMEEYSEAPTILAKLISAKNIFLTNLFVVLIGIIMQLYIVSINFVFLNHHQDHLYYISENLQIPLIATGLALYLFSFILPLIFYRKKRGINDFSLSTTLFLKKYLKLSVFIMMIFTLFFYVTEHLKIDFFAVRIINLLLIVIGVYFTQSLIAIFIVRASISMKNTGTYIGLIISSQGIGNIIGFVLCVAPFLDKYAQSFLVSTLGININLKNYSYFDYKYFDAVLLIILAAYTLISISYEKLILSNKTVE